MKWLAIEQNIQRVLNGRPKRREEEVCCNCGVMISNEEVASIVWEEDDSELIGYRCAEYCEFCTALRRGEISENQA